MSILFLDNVATTLHKYCAFECAWKAWKIRTSITISETFCFIRLQTTNKVSQTSYVSQFVEITLGLFVGVYPLKNFSLIWRCHHCRWRAANFALCSVLMAIEQWGSFNVTLLLRHGPTVYNGHLRGTVTLTPDAERLAVDPSQPVITTKVCR